MVEVRLASTGGLSIIKLTAILMSITCSLRLLRCWREQVVAAQSLVFRSLKLVLWLRSFIQLLGHLMIGLSQRVDILRLLQNAKIITFNLILLIWLMDLFFWLNWVLTRTNCLDPHRQSNLAHEVLEMATFQEEFGC